MVEVYEFWAVIVSLIVVKLCHWIYQWKNPKGNGKLPPGSMGYPIIGETFEFMKPHDAIQLPTFVKEKVLRLLILSIGLVFDLTYIFDNYNEILVIL